MTTQFARRVTVEIGDPIAGVKVMSGTGLGLRVAFNVERDTKSYPNNAEIGIWNLAPETRAKILGKKELTCRIKAGYEGNVQQIFFGTMRKAWVERALPDIVFRASAGDDEAKLVATIERTCVKGTPVTTVLASLVSACGFLPGNLAEVADARLECGATIPTTLVLAGSAIEELSEFTRSVGLTWSIQDGAFQFLRTAAPFVATQGPIVSPYTGLIGSPCQEFVKDKGDTEPVLVTSGKALMLPDLAPGKRFLLQSAEVTGMFVARVVKHYGDTAGQEWYTEFQAVNV